MDIPARIVDPGFGAIHRVVIKDGRWFTDAGLPSCSPPPS